MRKRYALRAHTGIVDTEAAPNRLIHGPVAEKLGEGQLADRKNERGLQQPHLRLQPMRAGLNLDRGRNAIPPLGFLPGKTTADGGKIETLPDLVLSPAESRGKPLEQGLARSPGKGAPEEGLLVAGSLTHKQHGAGYRTTNHDRLVHGGTALAGAQARQMGFNFQRSRHGLQLMQPLRHLNPKKKRPQRAAGKLNGRDCLVEATLAAITTIAAEAAALATETAATAAAAEAATLATTAETTALATTEAAASGAIFLRTGLVDSQLTATDLDAIGLLSGNLRLFRCAHRDERKTAGASGHAVKGDVNVGHGTVLLEVSTKLVGRGLEGQVADVEFGTLHVMIS